MTKRLLCFSIGILCCISSLLSQNLLDSITEFNAKQIISVLASDSLRGRGNGTPELLKAGLFIGEKFKQIGLQCLPRQLDYYFPFKPYGGNTIPAILDWNDKPVSADRFIFINPVPGIFKQKDISDFEVVHIDSAFSDKVLKEFSNTSRDILLWTSVKQADGKNFFPEFLNFPALALQHKFLLVYAEEKPDSLSFKPVESYYSAVEYNVVGMLRGRSKSNEYVVISAHYDHVGINTFQRRDSVMNGANDDASGVTALLWLADYFSLKGDNERTILFCAFAGEELGLLGSKQFVKILDPQKITANINIEMIGVPQYGTNNAFITGAKYSTLPAMLKQGMEKLNIRLKSEPDKGKNLFMRSDNYSFALKSIPAHTIMTSDDSDKCYHKPCDEVDRINISHLTNITRGIAIALEPIISGKETPTRISSEKLN